MPYAANSELPASVQHALPGAAQTIWRKAFDSAYEGTCNGDDSCAAAVAWSAVKQAYKKLDGKWITKMHLEEINPSSLRHAPEQEVLSLHHRVHELYAITKNHAAIENIVNAHKFIVAEMKRRDIKHNTQRSGLDAEKILTIDKKKKKRRKPGPRFATPRGNVLLPNTGQNWDPDNDGDIDGPGPDSDSPVSAALHKAEGTNSLVIVPDYISLVGSAVDKGLDNANDLDILVRDDPSVPKHWKENLFLLVRRTFDPDKIGKRIHLLFNPQGPHGSYAPVYDLVLRPHSPEKKFIKAMATTVSSPGEGELILDTPGATYHFNKSVIATMDGVFTDDTLAVERHPVVYDGSSTYGLLIKTLDKSIAFIPQASVLPSWATDADLIFLDSNGIIDGHREAINKSSIPGAYFFDEVTGLTFTVPRPGPYIMKTAIVPITTYAAQKPKMTGYTDFVDPHELYDKWGEEALSHGPVYISPKIDGYRTILQRNGDQVSIRFEDFKQERAKELPTLVEAIKHGPDQFIIEGELQVVAPTGHYYARPEVAGFLAGNRPGTPHVFLYDILFDETDIHDKPFSERYPILQKLAAQLGDAFIVLEQTEVKDKDSMLKEATADAHWDGTGGKGLPVEGVVARETSMPYVFGPTPLYAKIKKYCELKVKVLTVNKVADGETYTIALRGPDGDIDLGKTFVSADHLANVGETLNISIEELLVYPDGHVATGKPTPLGPDRSRPAYTVEQAISLARRFGVAKDFQDKLNETKKEQTPVPQSFVRRLAQKMLHPFAKLDARSLDESGEGMGTRGEKAQELFAKNWADNLPPDGKGRFVYHHHWRGLPQDMAEHLDDAHLLHSDHSVHGDLRLEGDGALWGWTIFTGRAQANLEAGSHGDRLIDWDPHDGLQTTPKLPQPLDWLLVARNTPLVHAPGEVGATTQSFAKFFAKDFGTYQLGVCRQHFFEVFMTGKVLKGKLTMELARFGEGDALTSAWVVARPDDQTPYAEKHSLKETLQDVHSKQQDSLVWAKPGESPRRIAVAKDIDGILAAIESGMDDFAAIDHVQKALDLSYHITKAQEEQRYTLGPMYIPNKLDAHGEFTTPDELQKAVWEYVRNGDRMIHLQHTNTPAGEWVEILSWPYPIHTTMTLPGRGEQDVTFPEGTVYLGVIWQPWAWDLIKSGKLKGYSMGGFARRISANFEQTVQQDV